jgi:methionyl-tRNA synthetase
MARFYLTTAIDYVNSRPHLGTAYEKITADAIARYQRLRGVDTLFVMGNDEHSQNVYRRAVEEGVAPLAYCDRMEEEFRGVWSRLDISFDDFIRTSQPRHRAAVTEFVRRSAAAGDIYEGFYEGWYCVSCEAFKQEKDLVEGACPIHQRPAEWIRERNHFFRLSKYRDALQRHFDEHPEFLEPDVRRNEILRLLEGGLEDISVSRAGQAWGIPVPFDPESVVYVWYDALINYASAAGFGTDAARFERWWPADLHIIGKDITRFHTVVWPAMLMSAGVALPRQVFGHGFVTFKGQKMSKSLGTMVDPIDAAERYGTDPLRLFLVKEVTYGTDPDFSWERFEERYNVDLANNLGNLVSRVTAMADRYRQGRLVSGSEPAGRLAAVAGQALADYTAAMDRLAIHDGAAAAFRLVDATNEFIAETEPWVLARDPAAAPRLDRVLFDAAESVRIAAILLQPFMPASCAEILRRVGGEPDAVRLAHAAWRGTGERRIAGGAAMWPRTGRTVAAGPAAVAVSAPPAHATTGPAPARPTPSTDGDTRVDTQPSPQPAAAPAADRITIDDFMKIELRVAKVVAAEKVPNSKKLIKLQVDVGAEQRTLVAGIAESYEAEALVGRTVVIVANLKPAKLMGIESNGMVLAASPDGGKPMLVGFDVDIPPGTRVR